MYVQHGHVHVHVILSLYIVCTWIGVSLNCVQVGMKQEYFLGSVLRARYVDQYGLINPNYTRVQVSLIMNLYTCYMYMYM